MKSSLIALVLLGFVSPVFAMGGLPSSMEAKLADNPAPDFTLETTAGKTLSLTQAREGKNTVMIFWATWCPHCREELESLKQKINTIQQRGVKLLLVDAGESKEEAKSYLQSHQVPLESFVDEDNTVAGRYSVIGIPTLIFIDQKGIVRSIEHEFPNDYESKFGS